MSIVIPGSQHEGRLKRESRVQARRLKRVVRHYGGWVGKPDLSLEKINFNLGLDIVGLVALPIRIGKIEAIALTAPGVYFGSDWGRARLSWLVEALQKAGCRALLVTKHSLNRRARRLELQDGPPPIARRDGERMTRSLLVSTGRRPRPDQGDKLHATSSEDPSSERADQNPKTGTDGS
ncbi:hypothetical protein [Chenggangzhangella methanolivorans]|uniref:hypothetical protein n=1 Tax=Chenggangzhangella methanolivorans TaxID=1437009 RepID=UPI003672861B